MKALNLSIALLDLTLTTTAHAERWIVENAKPARAALNIFSMSTPIRELKIHEIKEVMDINKLLLYHY